MKAKRQIVFQLKDKEASLLYTTGPQFGDATICRRQTPNGILLRVRAAKSGKIWRVRTIWRHIHLIAALAEFNQVAK